MLPQKQPKLRRIEMTVLEKLDQEKVETTEMETAADWSTLSWSGCQNKKEQASSEL
jgi:hypothetical protein